MKIDEEQVQLMKRRGGVGHDLSHIRPKGSPVMNSALTSTGVVPFMERYSNSTREVAQDGRRGALMLSVSIKHPDAEAFIDAKMDGTKVSQTLGDSAADVTDKTGISEIYEKLLDAWMEKKRKLLEDVKVAIQEKQEQQQHEENDDDNANVEEYEYEYGENILNMQDDYLEELYTVAHSATTILEKMKGSPSNHHFLSVLETWADLCEVSHFANEKQNTYRGNEFCRGAPQRAQRLMLEFLHDPEKRRLSLATKNNNNPQAYNHVIRAWAYSGEYLRGTMAEQLFQNMSLNNSSINKKTATEGYPLPSPNAETYRLILRANSWSKEKLGASIATGHFNKMMRLLESGQVDMEPTLEDYHTLLAAWTRAP